jgi:hypothetical protein
MNLDVRVAFVEPLPEDDFFTVEALARADNVAKSDPANVTDRQLRMIASYNLQDAQFHARKRAEARAAAAVPAAVARTTAASKPRVKSTQEHAAELDEWFNAVLQFLNADVKDQKAGNEAIDHLLKVKGDDQALTVLPILQALRASNKRNKARTESIELLQAETRRLESLLVLADQRVKKLEASTTRGVPGVRWAGTHEAGHEYHEGELVSRSGLWLCTAPSTKATPGSNPSDWKLVVHRKLVPTDDGR